MMRGRPAVYATFSSYDEVAHHSGSSAPTRWRRCASSTSSSAGSSAPAATRPRPYEIVVLSDHGQTQGATFKQRNGYGLDELVERSLGGRRGRRVRRRRRADGDGRPRARRGDRPRASEKRAEERRLRPRRRSCSAPGNLGLDLPDGGAAPADAGGDRRAPPGADRGAARAPPRRLAAGALVRARRRGARRATASGCLDDGPVEGDGPARALLADRRRAPAAHRRLRARRRHHGRQLLRPRARRGLRVRGADLASTAASAGRRRARSSSIPERLALPDEPILGAAAVHRVLSRLARRHGSNGAPAAVGPSRGRMIRGRLRDAHRGRAPRARRRVHRDRSRRAERDLPRPAVAARRRHDRLAAGRRRRCCSSALDLAARADPGDRRCR